MLNIIYVWVKNVNNLRVISSKSSANLSTFINKFNKSFNEWVQNQFNNLYLNLFYNSISTTYFLINNLLNKSFTHNPQYLLIELIKKN